MSQTQTGAATALDSVDSDESIPDAMPVVCSQCSALRTADAPYCGDCGYIFTTDATPIVDVPADPIGGRYRLVSQIAERGGVVRFRGEDVGLSGSPLPVVIVRQLTPSEPFEPETQELPAIPIDRESFDLPVDEDSGTVELNHTSLAIEPPWPGVEWEHGILMRAAHLSLPRTIDSVTEGEFTYLIEEVPVGTPLWDAWDRPGITWHERYGWLVQIAEAIQRLHVAGAILEGLRPEMIVISPGGVPILADLGDLLPVPVPTDVPLRGGFSTAPELLLNAVHADERADLYAFGALVYALHMGRELSDLDFTLTGVPRAYLDRVPDANPYLTRLLSKTFTRDLSWRFPTDDGAMTDPTGFAELVQSLAACKRNLDRVRLDVASWSTTGIVRSGNEDGVCVYHSTEARLDDTDEFALILLADGMGGMDGGEIAASMALQSLRESMFSAPPFASATPPKLPNSASLLDGTTEMPALPPTQYLPEGPLTRTVDRDSPSRSSEAYAERIVEALRGANQKIFDAARAGLGARGMGCTAEVVLIDGAKVVIGHVGDSRVYHLHNGKLAAVTKDQTLVSRLVELGQLTAAEAETHPRRAELQQAIGGRPEVYPDTYTVRVEPGDWLLACSDGLSNQVSLPMMEAVLRDARSAEKAARRLVNLALFDGATDNVTVATVRVS